MVSLTLRIAAYFRMKQPLIDRSIRIAVAASLIAASISGYVAVRLSSRTQGVSIEGASSLSKGRYTLNVNYQRVRKIGEIGISAESNSRATFYVR